MQEELLTRAVSGVTPHTLAEEKLRAGKPLRIYFGIDPTGDRIHLGHSVPLRKMRAFQDAGHHVILVIGSFTAMIGDPTGRDAMREPLTKEDVEKNFRTYLDQAKRILDLDALEVRYNHEWLEKLGFQDIIELAGQFTVQQMLERDMFDERISKGKPIGLHEFLYPLMVGYDSLVLDVDCELGGNDQYFNMLAGRTLQAAHGKRDKFVLTTKLIEGTDGRKMSKTYDNCIYITDEANDMYGKVMRIRDTLISVYMECCTDIPMEEVRRTAEALEAGTTHPKERKMRLAKAIVTLYHGEEAAERAEQEFQSVFAEGGVPEEMATATVKKGTSLLSVVLSHKLASSKSEARRLFEQGAVKWEEEKIVDPETPVSGDGILKVGKRKFLRIALHP